MREEVDNEVPMWGLSAVLSMHAFEPFRIFFSNPRTLHTADRSSKKAV
jgi:hypothetical protein